MKGRWPVEAGCVATSRTGGGTRWLVRLADRDAARYARLVAGAMPQIDRQMGAGVLAGRGHDRDAFGTWRRARSAAGGTGQGVAVISDVRACFESIGRDPLDRALAQAGVCGARRDELDMFLAAMHGLGVPGLPVGPAPSAALANVVLAVADRAAEGAGARVLRWVDDVVLLVPDAPTARYALAAWTEGLASVGLRRNEDKTRVVPAQSLASDGAPQASVGTASTRGMMRAP